MDVQYIEKLNELHKDLLFSPDRMKNEKVEKLEANRTTEKRVNYLVSESNFHTIKFFTEKLLAIEKKKTKILMNEPVYL